MHHRRQCHASNVYSMCTHIVHGCIKILYTLWNVVYFHFCIHSQHNKTAAWKKAKRDLSLSSGFPLRNTILGNHHLEIWNLNAGTYVEEKTRPHSGYSISFCRLWNIEVSNFGTYIVYESKTHSGKLKCYV